MGGHLRLKEIEGEEGLVRPISWRIYKAITSLFLRSGLNQYHPFTHIVPLLNYL